MGADTGGGFGTPTGDRPGYIGKDRQRVIEAEIKANLQRGHNAMREVVASKGEVVGAMERADVGEIDFVWSRMTGKHEDKERGIKHILDRRDEQEKTHPGKNVLSPDETLEKLVEVIARGHAHDTGNGWEIEHEGYLAILTKARRGQNAWMVSGFQDWMEGRRGGDR